MKNTIQNNIKPNIPKLRFPEFEGEWEKKRLGDIATFSKGKGLSKSDITKNGANKCIRYGELYTEYNEVIDDVVSNSDLELTDCVISEANDVIIPASGETLIDIATASCVIKSGIILGGDLNIIKTKNNGVFLSYYLNYRKKIDIARLAQGISVVHLYSTQLGALNLNLPTLAEQKKIATFLTAVDSKLQALKKKKELLEQYKKGVMQKIFSQEIRFKQNNGKNFPDWESKALGEVFNSIKGEGLSKDKISIDAENKCILYGELYTTYSEVVNKIKSKTNFNEGIKSKVGDLLVPCSTTTTRIDLANVTALNKKDVLLGGDITVLRANQKVDNIFFAYYLSNYKKYELAKYGQGTTIVHLYYNHFKAMNIEIPCIEEQTKIADFLTAIDEKIKSCEGLITNTENYKKGLLQQMFV